MILRIVFIISLSSVLWSCINTPSTPLNLHSLGADPLIVAVPILGRSTAPDTEEALLEDLPVEEEALLEDLPVEEEPLLDE